ncbi:sn-glycerol-3-phosphate ABC transporter ATP-binding protein UgpC (plasmid) [Shinella yambaruensis]|uniref:ABC transporter ATP-binding protein n=1 Tax=Shinella yambaruensis TaxID=415996 RepID=UPI003D7BE396
MSSLHIENVNKSYGSLPVLKNIDIKVESGEFLVLIGPSGCGKSTLLSAIAGISDITSGRLLIDDHDITQERPKDRDIAMVFQSYALYPNMTVRRNMGFALEMQNVPRAERDAMIERVAEQLQLTAYLDRKPAHLSGGQRQRVAMGRALVRSPKVFLFDEPLSNLDAKLRVEMRTELKKMHQRLGATIVYVTHDQIEAMTLASRIVVMKGGIIQQVGTPKEVYNRPANTFVATFIGSPAINLVPGRLDPSKRTIEIDGPSPVTLKLPDHVAATVKGPCEILFGLRPEAIETHTAGRAGEPDFASVQADVEVLEPTGPDTLAILRWQNRELTARLGREDDRRPLASAEFLFDMNQAMIFDAATQANIT